MIKNTTVIDKKIQNELSRKYLVLSILSIVIGIIGVVLYGIRDSVFPNTPNTDLLIVFVLPIGIGLLLLYTVFRTRSLTTVQKRENTYEFYDDKVVVSSLKEGESKSSVIDVPYNEIASCKRTLNYIFMVHKKEISMPVCLKGMRKEDVKTIKSYLKMK